MTMTTFFMTFAAIAIVISLMAIGVMFGRKAIKGSCGGVNNGECICVQKCEKRRKLEAAMAGNE
jgi:hypothetical protein